MMGTKLHKFCLLGIVAGLMFTACGEDENSCGPGCACSEDNNYSNDSATSKKPKSSSSKSSDRDFIIDTVGLSKYNYIMEDLFWERRNIYPESDRNYTCYTGKHCFNHYFCDYLFPSDSAKGLCGSGAANIPTKADWIRLENFLSRKTSAWLRIGMDANGHCFKKENGEQECSDDGKFGYYLTQGNLVYKVNFETQESSFVPLEENEYVGVKCVGNLSIVKSIDDLPNCDEDLSIRKPVIHVLEKGYGYRCVNNSWYFENYNGCYHEASPTIFDDNGTKYACSLGWHIANPIELKIKCDATTVGNSMTTNDTLYRCNGKSWEQVIDNPDTLDAPDYPCTKDINGKLDSIKYKNTVHHFICTDSVWREPTAERFAGPCNEKNYNDTLVTPIGSFVCNPRQKDWRKYSEQDYRYGACIESRYNQFDDGTYDRTHRITTYICDPSSGEWTRHTIDNVNGECTQDLLGNMGVYLGTGYWCYKDSERDSLYWSTLKSYYVKNIEELEGITCNLENVFKIIKSGNDNYICYEDSWELLVPGPEGVPANWRAE